MSPATHANEPSPDNTFTSAMPSRITRRAARRRPTAGPDCGDNGLGGRDEVRRSQSPSPRTRNGPSDGLTRPVSDARCRDRCADCAPLAESASRFDKHSDLLKQSRRSQQPDVHFVFLRCPPEPRNDRVRPAGATRPVPSKQPHAAMNTPTPHTTPMPTDPRSSFFVRLTLALSRAPR